MGTNCAPLIEDLFLFCYERDFMRSLSREGRADIVEAFRSTSGYLDDLLSIDNICFARVGGRVCPAWFRLGGANSSGAGAPFLDLGLCVSGGAVSAGVCDRRDDFGFDIVGFPFLGGGVSRRASCGVCMSRLVGFARALNNCRGKALTAKLLGRGCHCFGLRGAFSGFCRRRGALLERYGVGLGALLRQGVSELEFYGDLVYGFGRIVGGSGFSEQFGGLIDRYKRVGYGLDVVR